MSRRIGNRYENEVCAQAEALGYCAFPARGSRGPIDIVCFSTSDDDTLPSLAVQVGTSNKPISATLAELDTAPRPIGSRCVVARRHRQKNRRIRWTFHTPDGKFDSLKEAL